MARFLTESIKYEFRAVAISFESYVKFPFICNSLMFLLVLLFPVNFFMFDQISLALPLAFLITLTKKFAFAVLIYLVTLFLSKVNKCLLCVNLVLRAILSAWSRCFVSDHIVLFNQGR